MSTLHRIEVTERLGPDGVITYATVGERVTVDGVPMVRLEHGTIVAANGWHTSRTAALLAAEHQIEAIRLRLIGQSERLRAEADEITAAATAEAAT